MHFIQDNLKYKYDKNGNITEIHENGKFVVRYLYDSLNRLVREDNKVLTQTYLYEYDNNGNIVSIQTTSFTLKENVDECTFTNDVYVYDGDRLVSFNGEECEYNNAGNPTMYRDVYTTWKYGKLLASYNGVNFVYDGQGRRIEKNDVSYTYDAEGNLIKSSDGLEFIYDNSGVLGVKYNNTQYFYRKDVQGNIIALLDITGAVVVKYIYDAWGNHAVLDAEGNDISNNSHIGNINPFRYRGYYYDTETGLYYLQTRYYDPEVGRFISQDSIEYADPETINGLNLYAYCGNNPVMNIDPLGNKGWYWLLSIGIAVASIVLTVATAGVGAAVVATVVGGLIGGGFGAISAAVNGQNVLIGFAIGLINGITLANTAAVAAFMVNAGVIAGTLSMIETGAKVAMIGGFAGGALNELGTQLFNDGQINFADITYSATLSALFNVLSAGLGLFSEFHDLANFENGCFSYITSFFTGVASFTIDFIKQRFNKYFNRR